MELTRKYRCDSPTCNRSSTRAPLLLLHHACGPSCNSQVYLINFPHSRICFIITISTTIKSFFQSFLNILRFLISPINIVILCPTTVIIPYIYLNCFCLNPELSLPRHWTVTVSFLNCYCLDIELLLSCFWTVTVLFFNCYCLDIELLLSICYSPTSPQIFNYI
jgi:hypothetical protein